MHVGRGKLNVEERATQRAVSAYITWSVEEDGLERRVFPHGEEGFCVVNFPTHILSPSRGFCFVDAPVPGAYTSRLCSFAPPVLFPGHK